MSWSTVFFYVTFYFLFAKQYCDIILLCRNVWSTGQRKEKSYAFDIYVCLNQARYQLAMAKSVCWYQHVLRREDGHIFRRALTFELEDQRKNVRSKGT